MKIQVQGGPPTFLPKVCSCSCCHLQALPILNNFFGLPLVALNGNVGRRDHGAMYPPLIPLVDDPPLLNKSELKGLRFREGSPMCFHLKLVC